MSCGLVPCYMQLEAAFLTCPQQEPAPLIDLDWESPQVQSYERHGGVAPVDTAQPRVSSSALALLSKAA